jgi:hypothetical protein
VLEVIGRMAIEHPHVPMAMVSEEPVSLEIAEFLAGRGVSVVRAEPEDGEAVGLSGLVSRMHERRQRSLASS